MKNSIRNQWDRVLAGVFVVAGAIALIVGYFGVSGTLDTGKQLPYVVSGAMTSLFLLGIGALFWIAADLRDEWRKLDDIERHIHEQNAPAVPVAAARPPARARTGD